MHYIEDIKLPVFFGKDGELQIIIGIPYQMGPFISETFFDELVANFFKESGDSYAFIDEDVKEDESKNFVNLDIYRQLDIIWATLQLDIATFFRNTLKVSKGMVPSVEELSFTFDGGGRVCTFVPMKTLEDLELM